MRYSPRNQVCVPLSVIGPWSLAWRSAPSSPRAASQVTALSQKVLKAAEDNVRMTRIAFQADNAGAAASSHREAAARTTTPADTLPDVLHLTDRQLKFLNIRLAKALPAEAETQV